jgi:hypothetical protein
VSYRLETSGWDAFSRWLPKSHNRLFQLQYTHGSIIFKLTISWIVRPVCMRCKWHRMHCTHFSFCCIAYDFHIACNDTACNNKKCRITSQIRIYIRNGCSNKKCRITSRIRIYIQDGFSPLIRVPGRMFEWKKPEDRKARDTVPLTTYAETATIVWETLARYPTVWNLICLSMSYQFKNLNINKMPKKNV